MSLLSDTPLSNYSSFEYPRAIEGGERESALMKEGREAPKQSELLTRKEMKQTF